MTFEGANNRAVYSPDGSRVAFDSSREGTDGFDLFVKDLNADSPPRSIITLEAKQFMMQWPSDTLIVFERGAGGVRDLWMVNLSDLDNPSAEAYLSSEADLQRISVSPDGTLAAYRSNESGIDEIYIRSFPVPGERTVVSQGGGAVPFWSPDGNTLYYATGPGQPFMAARLQRDPVPVVLSRDSLFARVGFAEAREPLISDRGATQEGMCSHFSRLRLLGLFALFLEPGGRSFPMDDFGQHHTDAYLAARRSGKVQPDHHRVISPRDGTLRHELRALSTVCNWAVGFRVDGRRLLAHNPVRDLTLPQERNVKRPVASRERFEKLLSVSDQVDDGGQFRAMLQLAWHTGRRISAIVHLRASDVLLTPNRVRQALAASGQDESDADEWPHAIRWRAEYDKGGFETITPIGRTVVRELEAILHRDPRVGDAVVFTLETDATRPATRHTARKYLDKARILAGLPRIERGGWHAFRRAWATTRKSLPLKDVMAAGGWRAAGALRTAYQAADPKTTREVVEFGETG